MALFYNHIKGFMETSGSINYTEIKFAQSGNRPSINTYVDENNPTSLGEIITTKGSNQTFEQCIIIPQMSWDGNKYTAKYDTSTAKLTLKLPVIDTADFSIKNNSVDILQYNTTNSTDKLSTSLPFISTSSIAAKYFNATSDIRAKENIQVFNQSALNLINNLNTYTFNYKGSDELSYGIMAQDIQDYQINGFGFVENAAATGENDDFMSVRESKLVYLLIEGMKEQQKQINQLKQEIDQIKSLR